MIIEYNKIRFSNWKIFNLFYLFYYFCVSFQYWKSGCLSWINSRLKIWWLWFKSSAGPFLLKILQQALNSKLLYRAVQQYWRLFVPLQAGQAPTSASNTKSSQVSCRSCAKNLFQIFTSSGGWRQEQHLVVKAWWTLTVQNKQ